MSPSVQCLSVRMPRCSFQPILTGTNHLPCYASLQAGMGSIPSGIDPFNSDLAGMPISLLMLFFVVYSVFAITLQLYLIIYQSMTTIVSLLLFIILFLSIIVMYLHHYLHQVFKCIFIEHGNIIQKSMQQVPLYFWGSQSKHMYVSTA